MHRPFPCRRLVGLLAISLFLFAFSCPQLRAQESYFQSKEIPDSIWTVMQGKTFRPNPHVSRQQLRYLRLKHWGFDGRVHNGEMVCNKAIAEKLVYIFRKLFEAHYEIERIELPDNFDADDERQMRQNNTSCFCYRSIKGSRRVSNHALGLAVDLNPLYNPHVKKGADGRLVVHPSTASRYADRQKTFSHKIDRQDLAYRLFTSQGFSWGGAWRSSKDYQHFEITVTAQ